MARKRRRKTETMAYLIGLHLGTYIRRKVKKRKKSTRRRKRRKGKSKRKKR